MEKFLAEDKVIKKVIGPVDLNTGANTGSRVDMKNVKRVTFVLSVGAGTSTSAHSLVLQQHTLGSGGVSSDISSINPYFHKIASATSFTKVTPAVAAATYDLHSLMGNDVGIVVFEVLAEQLSSGCEWVSIDFSDVGGAQLGSAIAIVDHDFKPAYAQVV